MTDPVDDAKARALASRRQLVATLGEVQHRFSPKTMVNEAVAALKDNGTSWVKGGIATIKNKPIKAAMSLLSFVGPLSRTLGGRNRPPIEDGGSIMSTIEDNTLERKSGTANARISSPKARAADKLSNVAGTAAAKARNARGYAQDKLAEAREAATTTYSSAVEKGSELAQKTRVKAGQVAHQVEEQVQTTPLSVVIGGIALGTILGLVLPRTKREAELLGDAGRRVTRAARSAVQQAKDAGQERLDQLGATGEAALKVAKLVGEKSGLTAAVTGKSKSSGRATGTRARATTPAATGKANATGKVGRPKGSTSKPRAKA